MHIQKKDSLNFKDQMHTYFIEDCDWDAFVHENESYPLRFWSNFYFSIDNFALNPLTTVLTFYSLLSLLFSEFIWNAFLRW